MYYFYLFACSACFQSPLLGADNFKNLQELEDQEFE
jgi:hypothetical protein